MDSRPEQGLDLARGVLAGIESMRNQPPPLLHKASPLAQLIYDKWPITWTNQGFSGFPGADEFVAMEAADQTGRIRDPRALWYPETRMTVSERATLAEDSLDGTAGGSALTTTRGPSAPRSPREAEVLR